MDGVTSMDSCEDVPWDGPLQWELVNGTVFHLRHAPHFVYPRNMPRPRHRPLFRSVESITLIQGGTVCGHCLYFAVHRSPHRCSPLYEASPHCLGGLAWTP